MSQISDVIVIDRLVYCTGQCSFRYSKGIVNFRPHMCKKKALDPS